MTRLTLEAAQARVAQALQRAGANAAMAQATAQALVLAQAQGLASHGLSRVAQYCAHLRNGRADGTASPTIVAARGGAALIDARMGLAFAACGLAVQEAIERARAHGVAWVAVTNSHHFGVAVDHLRPVARAGMVGVALSNSPAAMPAAGGRHAVFGTNPVAAIFPRAGKDDVLIDLSLSEVARGKLMVAAEKGQPIPLGWALDREGQPTTDPAKGLEGSMLPIGAATSVKGAMLAFMVELLVTTLSGAAFGSEASSFFVEAGNQPRLGQAFLVIDPGALAGTAVYASRLEALVAELQRDPEVRLPGARRAELLQTARREGLEIADALLATWNAK